MNWSDTIYLFNRYSYWGGPIGYHQQPSYPEYAEQLLQLLQLKINEESVDFVVHGGDLVDSCQPGLIKFAGQLFHQLSIPIYLCLGNHDVNRRGALNTWLEN